MTLYLLPNLLDKTSSKQSLPVSLEEIVPKLDGLIAEGMTSGRRFLSLFREDARDVPIALFDRDCDFLLEPILKGETWGFVTDCGLPCLADPGHLLVKRARMEGVAIKAIGGPSSIASALMLSGLPTQHFVFHGYLPKDEKGRANQIRRMRGTHVFIEAPYRNEALFQTLTKELSDNTKLSLCIDIDTENEEVQTKTIAAWKRFPIPLKKRLVVFVVNS